MAKIKTPVPKRVWTQVTTGNASTVTVQVVGNNPVWLQATADTTPPTADDLAGAFLYNHTMGERTLVLADVFLGVASPQRLWAWSAYDASEVSAQHA